MGTATFGPANNQWQLHAAYLFNQQFVIKRIFVDVDAPPLALIGLIDGNNPKTLPAAKKMRLPEFVGSWRCPLLFIQQ